LQRIAGSGRRISVVARGRIRLEKVSVHQGSASSRFGWNQFRILARATFDTDSVHLSRGHRRARRIAGPQTAFLIELRDGPGAHSRQRPSDGRDDVMHMAGPPPILRGTLLCPHCAQPSGRKNQPALVLRALRCTTLLSIGESLAYRLNSCFASSAVVLLFSSSLESGILPMT
jgi:hypothetical protein